MNVYDVEYYDELARRTRAFSVEAMSEEEAARECEFETGEMPTHVERVR